jgi:uncharacterized glyoxalase superfamily protein PhnB
MGTRGIDQVNVVVGNADLACRFLTDLGIDIEGAPPEWATHHRAVPVADAPFDVDFDSSAFAAEWGGLPASFTGVVVNLRVDQRPEVDVLHERALALGARSLKAPYDAFWGSRFAVVEGPGPIVVGLKSTPDASHRTSPPDPSSLG